MTDDVCWLDATAQAEAVGRGELSGRELVESAVRRAEALDPALGALVDRRFDRARDEAAGASGPLAGVPFAVKDASVFSTGDRYQHGMRFLRDREWRCPHDSELVARYRRAGLVLVGRTKVPELSVAPTTEPLAHGPARNPWDPARTPGGSSGGSAVAVASGIVAAAHASDSGGSIRIPASCCGLVGLKPTRDRTTFAPDRGQGWGPLTHHHVLTRSVRDSASLLDLTAGPVPGDLHTAPPPRRPWADELARPPERLRVGVVTALPNDTAVDPVCAQAAVDAGTLLASLGHEVEQCGCEWLVDPDGGAAYVTVLATAVAHDVQTWEGRLGEPVTDLEPMTAMLAEHGRGVSGPAYVSAVDALARWSRRVAAATGGYDVVVTPTLPLLPPPLGVMDPADPDLATTSAMAAFVLPFDVSGQPAVSLPLHRTDDLLPVGVQLVAGHAREDVLLQVGEQLEQARPWGHLRPAVAAAAS